MTQSKNIERSICITAGLSAIWPIFRGDGIASLITLGTESANQLHAVYLAYLLTVLIASLASAARWKEGGTLWVSRISILLALSGLASGAALLLWIARLFGGLPLLVALGAALVYALWAASILPAWGQLGHLVGSSGCWVPQVVASFVVSLLPSTLGILWSEDVFYLAVAFAPVACTLCLWRVRSMGSWTSPSSTAPASSPALFGGEIKRIGLLVALILLGSLMRGLLNSGSISSNPSAGSLYAHGVSAVMAVAFVAILSRRRNTADTYGLLFVALSITMLAGLFLVALGVAHGNPLEPLSRGTVIAGRSCMGLLLWIMLATKAAKRPQTAPLLFGLFYTCVEAFASLLSYLLMPALAQYLAVDLAGNMLTCSLATAFVLVVITYAFLYDNRKAGVPDPSSCYNELARQHGLTDRERDVMRLVSQGNSVRKLAEELGLSVNTVQGYCKIVYRKMGIHSRQELIDLVRKQQSRA